MTAPRVAVLGGGACGMAAAFRLAQAGAAVTVLEREDRPGGLCGTVERNGFRFDLGGHRFVSRSTELTALVRELVGAELLLRTRSSAVLYRRRRFRYPLELDDVVRNVGLARGLGMTASYAVERLRRRVRPLPDNTFEDWVTHRFGPRLYAAFFGPYTEKLWGISPSQISADWAAQRISLPSLGDALFRLTGARRRSVPRTYARQYLYPRLGIGQIFERFAQATSDLGGRIELGAKVVGLSRRSDRVHAVRYLGADGRARELACDSVISTIALPAFARMLARKLPPKVAQAAGALRFRAVRLLNVLLNRPQVSPHTWMYVSEPRYLMARIQEPRQRSPEMAPAGQTSLMLEIPCDPGDPTYSASDAALYDRCMDDLAALGFSGLRADTLGYFSTFVDEGYPVYHLDYESARAQLLAFVGETANVVSCGRQGAFRYIFMDTAMEMGSAAAESVLGRAGSTGAAIANLRSEAGLIEAQALTA